MLPFKYLALLAVIIALFSGLCYVVGELFVVSALPTGILIEHTDGPTTFMYGVLVALLFFTAGIGLSSSWIVFQVHCIGSGLQLVPK